MSDLDTQGAIQAGREAVAFTSQPFFQKWLDYASGLSDGHLARLKQMPAETDARVKEIALLRWQIMEYILDQMQRYPYAVIEAGRQAEKEQNAITSISA